MKRVIIMGSPRSNGRSAHLAEMLFEANIDERPEDELYLVPVSEVEIGPCIGCGACRKPTEVVFKDDNGEEVSELRHRCIFDDDMQTLYDLLDDADELTVVSPIYFSGAPASMKCVLDRLQPYFWITQVKGREHVASSSAAHEGLPQAYVERLCTKRPATLHIIGEGGDPHGFDPLVGEAKSALACAGFRLQSVFDWVGKIDESGEITAEATEIVLTKQDGPSGEAAQRAAASEKEQAPRQRPKLDLSSSQKKRQSDTAQKGQRGPKDQRSQKGQQKGKRRG